MDARVFELYDQHNNTIDHVLDVWAGEAIGGLPKAFNGLNRGVQMLDQIVLYDEVDVVEEVKCRCALDISLCDEMVAHFGSNREKLNLI